ncbi:MAG: hypothetical protein FWE71_12600 [Nocardioidaceae bacterium]|nr:hypothetical protein [Nocardioidaceae bacterium]MCL2613279.1 hypothetical protein [Nocardioidaceae bacterium]
MSFGHVYVFYPRGLRTGGPEALHQLVDSLRRNGQKASLVPHPASVGNERVPDYDKYDAPESAAVVDAPGNAVVVPEVYLHGLGGGRHLEVFCWWLSIDNSPYFRADWQSRDPWQVTIEAPTQNEALDVARMRGMRHLTQSHYAWSYLFTRMGVTGSTLTDWTDTSRFDGGLPAAERGRTVAYNPTKAAVITELVKAEMPDVEFVPLRDMTPDEIAGTLSRSAIYLDLGHHPGRDRLPREAALAGATVVVARRGSAAYHVDVPLPREHRVDATTELPDLAAARIRAILDDPQHHSDLQKDYRAGIADERAAFEEQVRRVLVAHEYGD